MSNKIDKTVKALLRKFYGNTVKNITYDDLVRFIKRYNNEMIVRGYLDKLFPILDICDIKQDDFRKIIAWISLYELDMNSNDVLASIIYDDPNRGKKRYNLVTNRKPITRDTLGLSIMNPNDIILTNNIRTIVGSDGEAEEVKYYKSTLQLPDQYDERVNKILDRTGISPQHKTKAIEGSKKIDSYTNELLIDTDTSEYEDIGYDDSESDDSETKDNEPEDNESKDNEPEDNESKDNEPEDNESKDNESKDNESKDNELNTLFDDKALLSTNSPDDIIKNLIDNIDYNVNTSKHYHRLYTIYGFDRHKHHIADLNKIINTRIKKSKDNSVFGYKTHRGIAHSYFNSLVGNNDLSGIDTDSRACIIENLNPRPNKNNVINKLIRHTAKPFYSRDEYHNELDKIFDTIIGKIDDAKVLKNMKDDINRKSGTNNKVIRVAGKYSNSTYDSVRDDIFNAFNDVFILNMKSMFSSYYVYKDKEKLKTAYNNIKLFKYTGEDKDYMNDYFEILAGNHKIHSNYIDKNSTRLYSSRNTHLPENEKIVQDKLTTTYPEYKSIFDKD